MAPQNGERRRMRGRVRVPDQLHGDDTAKAVRPLPGLAAYSVSKAGVIMLGKSLAREWARQGINVNTICPGYVETEINADWLAEPGGQKMITGFPRRRVMDESSLDAALLHIASPATRFTTGAVLQVDDGQGL
jgi:NAD(P)-dependent dehydrogenase (short-subunit alcohol dehydrogenase family)